MFALLGTGLYKHIKSVEGRSLTSRTTHAHADDVVVDGSVAIIDANQRDTQIEMTAIAASQDSLHAGSKLKYTFKKDHSHKYERVKSSSLEE